MSLNTNQFAKHLRTATNVGAAVALGATAMAANYSTSEHLPPEGGWTVSNPVEKQIYNDTAASKPHNTPEWNRNLSRQFPGFSDYQHKPEGALNTHIVGITGANKPVVMTAQQAVDRQKDNNTANDTWWVGYK